LVASALTTIWFADVEEVRLPVAVPLDHMSRDLPPYAAGSGITAPAVDGESVIFVALSNPTVKASLVESASSPWSPTQANAPVSTMNNPC
jgi:hypothetical protein